MAEAARDTVGTGDDLLYLLERIRFAFRFDTFAVAQSRDARGEAAVDLQTPWGIKLLSGKYFAQMKRINKEGPRVLGGFDRPPRLAENRMEALVDSGALVIDTRRAADYAQGHIPGTLNVPLDRSFNTRAGWLVPYDQEFYLIIDKSCTHGLDEIPRDRPLVVHCQSGGRSAIAASLLRARGFDNVINLVGGYADRQAAGNPTEREAQMAGAR